MWAERRGLAPPSISKWRRRRTRQTMAFRPSHRTHLTERTHFADQPHKSRPPRRRHTSRPPRLLHTLRPTPRRPRLLRFSSRPPPLRIRSLARDAGRSRAMTGVLLILIHTFGYISKHQLVDLRRCCERPRHQLENPSTLRPAHGRPVRCRWLWSGHTEPNFVHCESVPQEGGRATRPAL